MTTNLFEFRLITTEEPILDCPIHMAVIPGIEGYFGVLKSHMDMVSLVKPGILELNMDNRGVVKYIVSYGICRINSLGCDLIVEDAVAMKNLDKANVENHIKSCEAELLTNPSAARKTKLEQKLEFLKLCTTV